MKKTITIINSNANHSQLVASMLTTLKKHIELIASLTSGFLILLGFLLNNQISYPTFVLINLSAFLIGGFAKAKEGILDTFHTRTLNVELLMVFAAIGSAIIGYWAEGAILIFIFSLSGALETYTMQKSERDLSQLMKLQPDTALRITDGIETRIPTSDLVVGDYILIKPGERIAADGEIIKGRTAIDESALTGESLPVEKSINDEVFTGTMNKTGTLTIKVTKDSSQSFVQKIMELVKTAQTEKSETQLFIEHFENRYVKAVLVMTGLMLFIPPFLVGWSWTETFYRAMILLVVASPCALVASITPATLSALSNGARKGMLIKGGNHLENFDKITAIAFDKTGTLTVGRPEVTDFIVKSNEDLTLTLTRLVQIEKGSSHPLAEAMIRFADQTIDTAQLSRPEEMIEQSGKGVCAKIDGDLYAIGNEKIFNLSNDDAWFYDDVTRLTNQAKTIVYITKNDNVIGLVALKDDIRMDTIKAIRALKEEGIHLLMLTGDNERTANAIAKEVGIDDYVASCLPEDKVNALNKLKSTYGNIMMIGDGINDAPALATAQIGVAMGAGSDVALETADIILIKNKLEKILDLRLVSKRMNRIIKQNIVFSISVITILILTNLFQIINLPLGVIGHEGSTILVILNGLRLLK